MPGAPPGTAPGRAPLRHGRPGTEESPRATDETSLALQKRFAAAVPRLVVSKDIDSVRLDRVAGNSGTPKGFNDALAQIKAEASG
ncbi:hypothetical protein [Streptomyces albicerus]|uniref:hypothetical protein n=1 Tax=Streptomyces albicerus TaxID=2569859 RepID=UPI001788C45E|nr:hypothetical protein [Streptomyces albicerus]